MDLYRNKTIKVAKGSRFFITTTYFNSIDNPKAINIIKIMWHE